MNRKAIESIYVHIDNRVIITYKDGSSTLFSGKVTVEDKPKL